MKKRNNKEMPAETGLLALALKNITFLGASVVGAIATAAVALYRLTGLETKHKTLQEEVTNEFIAMRESQRVADIAHLKEINRIEKLRGEDRLETERSLRQLQVEGLKARGSKG